MAKNGDNGKQIEDGNSEESVFRLRHAFMVIAVLLLVLAIWSHDPRDMNVLAGGSDAALRNWIGPLGAHIARTAFLLLGLATYPVLLFLILAGIRPLIPIPLRRRGFVGATVLFIFGTIILFALWPERLVNATQRLGIGHSRAPAAALSGGVIGQRLAAPMNAPAPGILRSVIGTVGTFVVGSVLLVASLVFVWLSDWHLVFQALAQRRRMAEKTLEGETESKEEKKPTWSKASQPTPELPPSLIEEEGEPEPAPVKRRSAASPPAGATKPTRNSSTPQLPPLSLLEKPKGERGDHSTFVEKRKELLQATLDSFGVDATVAGAVVGPRVTRYEITPEPGVKVEKISALSNNIAMDLQAKSIRVLAPIPGRNAVGVEVPNAKASSVSLRAMMESNAWRKSRANIPIILGKDVSGTVVVVDLAKCPHLLIAGATGSGKSVCMNTLLMSLLYNFTHDKLKLIMVDPKVVEFEVYKKIPHLISPIVNDPHKVPKALQWAIHEMERRYRVLSKVGVRNLEDFNHRKPSQEPVLDDDGNQIPDELPYVVILIDELADIMMIAKSDVETSIARIAQKARAVGIHMVLATQTPRKDIITGVIKANLPSRVAFRVGSIVDSRVILDRKGAETLLGQGDMLFLPPGSAELERIQGAWVADDEIKGVVNFVADQAEQEFLKEVLEDPEEAAAETAGGAGRVPAGVAKFFKPDDDDNIKAAIEIILTERKASTSYIQRRLKIGYNRAADIIDRLEERGIIGPPPSTGGANREILVDIDNA